MSEKLIGFRRTEEYKRQAEKVAKKYNCTAGALAGFLLDRFIDAYEEHGESVKFPPKFDYYDTTSALDRERGDLEQAG